MKNYKRGDIIQLDRKVAIQLGKHVQSCRRPYVIISNDVNNKYCPTVNVACLSKRITKADYPMHVFIKKDEYNLEYDSVIYCEQLLTVDKTVIERVVGKLNKEDLAKLNNAITVQLFDYSRDSHKEVIKAI